MNKFITPIYLEIYKYLDISSLIKIYKLQLINDFTENEEKRFYKIIWKQVLKNIKYYEEVHKPWKYNTKYGCFIYYFAAYNKIVPIYIKPNEWIKLFLLK